MKSCKDLQNIYKVTKSSNTSLNKEGKHTQSHSKPKYTNLLLPPQLLNIKSQRSRAKTCQSPPPGILNVSQGNKYPPLPSIQIKNPQNLRLSRGLKQKQAPSPLLNKPTILRSPPRFILNNSQKNFYTSKAESKGRRSHQKLQVKQEQSQWKERLSFGIPRTPNPTTKLKKCSSSSKKRSFQYSTGAKRVDGLSQGGESNPAPHANSTKNLLVPNLVMKVRTRSFHEDSPTTKRSSKVPYFIKQKQYAKSQQDGTSSHSDDSTKAAILEKMVQSAEVVSRQEKSANEPNNGIQINVKPAQKKVSIDDFELIRQIGKGSFGKAYVAMEKTTNFVCVLKLIDKEQLAQFQANNLVRQIKIQTYLNHNQLTALYGCFDDDRYVYLIMQLLPSGNLRDTRRKQPVDEKQVAKIILQVCKGISYMHENRVLHRDLKPENIFTFGNYVKLGDFGCAVYSDVSRNSFVGSPCYLSPEQLQHQYYDQKVDIWEIGTLTYQLLFKRCPFEKDILEMMQGQRRLQDLSNLVFPVTQHTVSDQAKHFIKCALEKNPKHRMSMEDAICHPFLAQMPHSSQPPKFLH